MCIEQLRLILCDMYQMDLGCHPLYGKWTSEFKRTSYRKWAIDEILDYIAANLHPRTSASIDEFCDLVTDFMTVMARYARTYSKNAQIFQIARNTAMEILDFLQCLHVGSIDL